MEFRANLQAFRWYLSQTATTKKSFVLLKLKIDRLVLLVRNKSWMVVGIVPLAIFVTKLLLVQLDPKGTQTPDKMAH